MEEVFPDNSSTCGINDVRRALCRLGTSTRLYTPAYRGLFEQAELKPQGTCFFSRRLDPVSYLRVIEANFLMGYGMAITTAQYSTLGRCKVMRKK